MYKASEFMSLLCCRAPRGEEECQHGVMGNRPSGNLALSFNALGQWMHQIAQHTAIELDNVTAKMMHHDTLIGSLVLVQAQFRNPAKDQQAVVIYTVTICCAILPVSYRHNWYDWRGKDNLVVFLLIFVHHSH